LLNDGCLSSREGKTQQIIGVVLEEHMMPLPLSLSSTDALPADGFTGTLVGRAWIPSTAGQIGGPSVVVLRQEGIFDISEAAPTMSSLLDSSNPVAIARATPGRYVGSVESLLDQTASSASSSDFSQPSFIAPCDLQVIKAAGVTFAGSMIERVIEERAKGDPQGAKSIREQISTLLGDRLTNLRPGSDEALRVKQVLIERGMWSQYLEVGIGPDAEVFTKAPVLSALGTGAELGLHPKSSWNNPEPEIVLAISSRAEIVGATLGNDVNLRDFEGRSALLLGKAKDNNGSCAIGPFLRLFDDSFSLDDVRRAKLTLQVAGEDGFQLHGASAMDQISRDPLDLVTQTMGSTHQYPDGAMLFLGTLFAPTQDRGAVGQGFTHKQGDIVTIASPMLGSLCNRIGLSDKISPWTFGLRALMANLADRGLLSQTSL
jgi:fumarylacetoacetate (FAA) hydrolase family protein